MRILIIDDNPDHRELVSARVKKVYPDAEIVEIIRQSMLDEKLGDGPPDLALTDYRLHWSDGLQVLEQIKKTYPDTPVIMVTDTGSEEIATAGMKGGLADYILKDHLHRLPIAIRESMEKLRLRQRAESERAQLIREQAARAEAEAGERRYRSLAEAIPQIVWTADGRGRFDYYNRRWFEYTGLTENESFEHDSWKHVLHEEDAESTLARWRGAVQSGEGFEIECRFRRASDGAYRWHLIRAIPVRNPNGGGVSKWFGACTDIDDQRRGGEAMREAQKLESIGLLAGGVAHDFNNLLTGILGNASLMLELTPPGNPLRNLLDNVVAASERAADLTRQLLAYSGKGRYFVEPVDLSQLVREIGALIMSSIPKKVRLELELADDLPMAEVDPTQIRQLVMNLVLNGAEAIGEERPGVVSVSTFFQPVDEIYLASVEFSLDGISPGDYIAVRVTDDGCGMDENVRQRIFDPFFTTKFTGRGLGLAAALGIVRGHHGSIRIQSAPGRGSIFEILIPASAAAERPSCKKSQPGVELRGEGAVLVIDDEDIVRKAAKSALERFGYEVLLAEDGRQGVDVFRKHRRKIKAVLLDMMMPVMGGEEALREITEISPGAAVIGSSGYSEALAMRRFGDKGLTVFLQKPYNPSALAECVKRAVERRVKSQAG